MEVDQAGIAVADDDILALEIPMHQAPRLCGKMRSNLAEAMPIHVFGNLLGLEPEVPSEAVLNKVILLPLIERRVELLLKVRAIWRGMRAGVQDEGLIQSALV